MKRGQTFKELHFLSVGKVCKRDYYGFVERLMENKWVLMENSDSISAARRRRLSQVFAFERFGLVNLPTAHTTQNHRQ